MRFKLRKTINNQEGGVVTYVMIMFGMIFILYLFGYTNVWNAYIANSSINGSAITDRTTDMSVRLISGIITFLQNNIELTIGGVLAVVGALIVGRLAGINSTILSFLIPLAILGILNIFVFPMADLQYQLEFAEGIGLTTFLFIFFNLFYVLAVIEYMRGTA